MNAVEFVKKFGWDVSKDLANRDKTSVGYLSVEHHDVCQDDLKRLVESYELVEKFGGLDKSKNYIDNFILPELSRAISYVEKCK